MTAAARRIEEAGVALAAFLAAEGRARPVSVPGLGVFHVRERGHDGGGWGVLFVLAPELRLAISPPVAGLQSKRASKIESDVLVFGDGVPAVDALAAWVRVTVASGADAAIPELGVFSPLLTTPKIFSDRATRTAKVAKPRRTVSFAPSPALRARLAAC